jgi:hypothetical protein
VSRREKPKICGVREHGIRAEFGSRSAFIAQVYAIFLQPQSLAANSL